MFFRAKNIPSHQPVPKFHINPVSKSGTLEMGMLKKDGDAKEQATAGQASGRSVSISTHQAGGLSADRIPKATATRPR
jgi:hypothetical protein